MTVLVSRAKELLLTKLHREEELPKLNQQFYSALYTSMRTESGHTATMRCSSNVELPTRVWATS